MKAIREIIGGRSPITLRSKQTVQEAAELMARSKVGAVPVVDDEHHVAGIFSERDLMVRVVAAGLPPRTTRVEEVMTTELVSARPSESYEHALAIMQRAGIRHLLVVEESGRFAGIISLRDLMLIDIDEKDQNIQLLHDYIYYRPAVAEPS
jgi:CBS domain-containing protein